MRDEERHGFEQRSPDGREQWCDAPECLLVIVVERQPELQGWELIDEAADVWLMEALRDEAEVTDTDPPLQQVPDQIGNVRAGEFRRLSEAYPTIELFTERRGLQFVKELGRISPAEGAASEEDPHRLQTTVVPRLVGSVCLGKFEKRALQNLRERWLEHVDLPRQRCGSVPSQHGVRVGAPSQNPRPCSVVVRGSSAVGRRPKKLSAARATSTSSASSALPWALSTSVAPSMTSSPASRCRRTAKLPATFPLTPFRAISTPTVRGFSCRPMNNFPRKRCHVGMSTVLAYAFASHITGVAVAWPNNTVDCSAMTSNSFPPAPTMLARTFSNPSSARAILTSVSS